MSKQKLVVLTWNLVRSDTPLLVPIYKADGTLLAQKGITLNDSQLSTLYDYEELYTYAKDLETALDLPKKPKKEDPDVAFKMRSPFGQLIQLRDQLIEIFKNPHADGQLDKVESITTRIQRICGAVPDVALATIFIDLQEHYTVQHAMHVAIVAELVSSYLGWKENYRYPLVAASLTMNISMGLLQDEFWSQQDKLNEQQRKLIHHHPLNSTKILQQMGVTDLNWLDYVEKHHEVIDGSGYPFGLKNDKVSLGASIIHIADIYCAKVTGRSYRDPIIPNEAAKQVFMDKERKSKGTAIEILVKTLGLYPPGCQVQLANGETGVVIKRGKRVDTPWVKSVMDGNGMRFPAPQTRDTSQPAFIIKDIIIPNVVKWDPEYEHLWGYGKKNQ